MVNVQMGDCLGVRLHHPQVWCWQPACGGQLWHQRGTDRSPTEACMAC